MDLCIRAPSRFPSGRVFIRPARHGSTHHLWFDQPGNSAEETAVRTLIRRFAEARNAHDGSAVAALYSEDGEFLDAAGEVAIHSRQNLAAIWSNLPGQV